MKTVCIITCLVLLMPSHARQTENNGMLRVKFAGCTLVFDPEELVSFQNCLTRRKTSSCTVFINKHNFSSWSVAKVSRIPETEENNSTTTRESHFVCTTTCNQPTNRMLMVTELRCRRQESRHKAVTCSRENSYYFTLLTRSSARSLMKQDQIVWKHTRLPKYWNGILIQAALCANNSTKLSAKNTPKDTTNTPPPSSVISITTLTTNGRYINMIPAAKLLRPKRNVLSLTNNPTNKRSKTLERTKSLKKRRKKKTTSSKIVVNTTTQAKLSGSNSTFKPLTNDPRSTPSPTSVSSTTELTPFKQSGDTTQAESNSNLMYLILFILVVPFVFVIALLIKIKGRRRKKDAHKRTDNDYLTPADIVYSEYELSKAENDNSVEHEYLEIITGDLILSQEVTDNDDKDMDYCGLIYDNAAGDYTNFLATRNTSVPALNAPGNINVSELMIDKIDESAINDEHYSTIDYVEHSTLSDAPYSTLSDAPYSTISDAPYSTISDAPYSTISDAPYSPISEPPYSNIAFIETATSHESSSVSMGVRRVRAAPGDTHYDHNIGVTTK